MRYTWFKHEIEQVVFFNRRDWLTQIEGYTTQSSYSKTDIMELITFNLVISRLLISSLKLKITQTILLCYTVHNKFLEMYIKQVRTCFKSKKKQTIQ